MFLQILKQIGTKTASTLANGAKEEYTVITDIRMKEDAFMERIRKSMLQQVLCMALSLLLLLTLLPQVTFAADTDRYGYTKLESAKEKKLYGMLVDAVEDC